MHKIDDLESVEHFNPNHLMSQATRNKDDKDNKGDK